MISEPCGSLAVEPTTSTERQKDYGRHTRSVEVQLYIYNTYLEQGEDTLGLLMKGYIFVLIIVITTWFLILIWCCFPTSSGTTRTERRRGSWWPSWVVSHCSGDPGWQAWHQCWTERVRGSSADVRSSELGADARTPRRQIPLWRHSARRQIHLIVSFSTPRERI